MCKGKSNKLTISHSDSFFKKPFADFLHLALLFEASVDIDAEGLLNAGKTLTCISGAQRPSKSIRAE